MKWLHAYRQGKFCTDRGIPKGTYTTQMNQGKITNHVQIFDHLIKFSFQNHFIFEGIAMSSRPELTYVKGELLNSQREAIIVECDLDLQLSRRDISRMRHLTGRHSFRFVI